MDYCRLKYIFDLPTEYPCFANKGTGGGGRVPARGEDTRVEKGHENERAGTQLEEALLAPRKSLGYPYQYGSYFQGRDG